MTTENNGRVTIAVLKNELGHLQTALERLGDDLGDKIDGVEDSVCTRIDDHETRIRGLESQKPWQIIGAYATAIIGSVASAVLGQK